MNPERKALRLAYRRLLSALLLLQEAGYEVTMSGLASLLRGETNAETAAVNSLPAFGAYPSLSGKTLKGRLHQLVRKGYIGLLYAPEDEDYYLVLTDSGRLEADPSLIKPSGLGPRKRKRLIRPISQKEKRNG
jgi:hypothetical protein